MVELNTESNEAVSTSEESTEASSPKTQKSSSAEAEEGFGIASDGKKMEKTSSQSVADELEESNAIDNDVTELLQDEELTAEEVQSLQDLSDEDIEALIDEEESDEGEKTETSESEEESSEPQVEKTDDIDDLITNRAQKRIDKLVAKEKATGEENTELKARIAALEVKSENKLEKKDDKKSDIISDTQLAKAIEEGVAEGDHSVIIDVIKYITKNVRDETLKEQETIHNTNREVIVKRNAEWTGLSKEYSPETYQNEILKTDPNFDLNDNKSQLFRLANRLFKDQNLNGVEGGQSRAVREAYSILLERKIDGTTPTPKKEIKVKDETEGLKQRLAKVQRKTSTLGGGGESEESTPTPITEENELDSYITERNARKSKSLGVEV